MIAASVRQRKSNLRFVQILCKCEELFYRLVVAPLIAFLPAPLAYRLACLRGDWRYRLDTVNRQQILSNLEGVFGEQLSLAERQGVARNFFRRHSCQVIDAIRLAGKGRALERLVEIRGLQHLEAALTAGKGAVICIAHFGSHASFPSLLGVRGFSVTAVDNSRSNPSISLIERLLWRFRLTSRRPRPRHLRQANIEPQQGAVEAAVRMAEVLRANEVLVTAIDVPVSHQDRAHAVPVQFLGRQVLLLPGSVSIAEHTGASLLVAFAQRTKQWHHQVLDILPISADGDIETTFQRCVSMVEAPIRQHLDLWDGCLDTQALVELGLLSI